MGALLGLSALLPLACGGEQENSWDQFNEERALAQAIPITDGVTVRLQAQHSGKCVGIGGASSGNGGQVIQEDCAEGDAEPEQQFVADEIAPGQFLLVAAHSGKCLDVAGYSTSNGGVIHQWSCHSQNNQRWILEDQGGNEYRLRSVHSNKCLDVAGVSTATGAQLHQWSCHGGGNQRFKGLLVDDSGTNPPGTHPDIVSISPTANTSLNPGGIGWADSFSHNGTCWCDSSNYDHNIGPVQVSTPVGTRTVFQVCEAQKASGNKPTRASGDPVYNDVQCGNGPPNDAGDEDPDQCPGRTDIGGQGCGHIGPVWDFSAFDDLL